MSLAEVLQNEFRISRIFIENNIFSHEFLFTFYAFLMIGRKRGDKLS